MERALSDAVPLADIDFSDLGGAERALTYALAHWLAAVDGIVNTQELATLRELAKKLDLPDLQLKACGGRRVRYRVHSRRTPPGEIPVRRSRGSPAREAARVDVALIVRPTVRERSGQDGCAKLPVPRLRIEGTVQDFTRLGLGALCAPHCFLRWQSQI